MQRPDFYELLGIPETATDEEIEVAYRRAAAYWHPDRNNAQNAAEMMQWVNVARDTLLSPTRRREYDALRKTSGPNSESEEVASARQTPLTRTGGSPPSRDRPYREHWEGYPVSDPVTSAPWGLRSVIAGALVGLAALFTLSLVVGIAAGAAGAEDPQQALQDARFLGISVGTILLFIQSAIFLAVAMWFATRRFGLDARLGFVSAGGLPPYLIAFGAWMGGLAIVGVWTFFVTEFGPEALRPPDNAQDLIRIAGGQLIPVIIVAGLFGPLAEETFFRGFLMPGLASRYGVGAGLLLSSMLFALIHVDPGLYVPTFVLGLMLGWVYLKTRSIWPSVAVHCAQNVLAISIASAQ